MGAAVVNRLEAEADRLYRAAPPEQRSKRRHDQWLADALAQSVLEGSTAHHVDADVVIHLSVGALFRGHAHDGEHCEVEGVGPVPVSAAKALMEDAFVKAVVTEGTEIRTVKHFGRGVPAELRTALRTRSFLRHGDVTCEEAGCDRSRGLEVDHDDPYANGAPMSYENGFLRCRPHHRAKTERDRQMGLLGPDAPGRRGRHERRPRPA